MDPELKEESFDELDSTAGQSFDNGRNATAMFGSASSSSIGNVIAVNVETTNSTAGNGEAVSTRENPLHLQRSCQTERKRYFEELQRENHRLKTIGKCYGCKTTHFSIVLLPCTHTACQACAKKKYCACSRCIEERLPCLLPTSKKSENG